MMAAMRALATTILDAVGLLLLAGGIGAGLSVWIGWWGMAVSGVIILIGSYVADRRAVTS